VVDGRLSPDHVVSDAVHLLDVPGNGYVRIYELFEGGQLAAVEAKAYSSYLDEAVHNREETSRLSIEGHKSDIGETWLGVIHLSSRPFSGELLTWKTAVSVDR
jgi:hypothetical protein